MKCITSLFRYCVYGKVAMRVSLLLFVNCFPAGAALCG